jgi:hypothetical protein
MREQDRTRLAIVEALLDKCVSTLTSGVHGEGGSDALRPVHEEVSNLWYRVRLLAGDVGALPFLLDEVDEDTRELFDPIPLACVGIDEDCSCADCEDEREQVRRDAL